MHDAPHTDLEVAARERDFHNKRFAQDEARVQGKYYFALKGGELLFRNRVESLSRGADVLEYGCSIGTQSRRLSSSARTVCGIDISDVAIRRAREAVAPNTRFFAMDALKMDFPDASFDLVFGSGIIHHLDVAAAGREIRRVLRPSGAAVFWEPLGHNPVINLYRRATPGARTPDEHPLLRSHISTLKKLFPHTTLKHFGFFTLGAVPFREMQSALTIRRMLEAMDKTLFAIGPLRWASWYAMIELRF